MTLPYKEKSPLLRYICSKGDFSKLKACRTTLTIANIKEASQIQSQPLLILI